MNNHKIFQNMTLMLSMFLDLFSEIESWDKTDIFEHDDLNFIKKCAHNTDREFRLKDQQRITAIAATFFSGLDNFQILDRSHGNGGSKHGTH